MIQDRARVERTGIAHTRSRCLLRYCYSSIVRLCEWFLFDGATRILVGHRQSAYGIWVLDTGMYSCLSKQRTKRHEDHHCAAPCDGGIDLGSRGNRNIASRAVGALCSRLRSCRISRCQSRCESPRRSCSAPSHSDQLFARTFGGITGIRYLR